MRVAILIRLGCTSKPAWKKCKSSQLITSHSTAIIFLFDVLFGQSVIVFYVRVFVCVC